MPSSEPEPSNASPDDPNLRRLEAEREYDARKRLAGHPLIDGKEVSVDVDHHHATLDGEVPTDRVRTDAHVVARFVPGVASVDNELDVQPPPEPEVPVDQIRSQVVSNLKSTNMDARDVTVSESGHVYVRGYVESWDEYNRVVNAVLEVTSAVNFDIGVAAPAADEVESAMPDTDEVY